MKPKIKLLLIIMGLSLLCLDNSSFAQPNFRFSNEINIPSTDSWNFIKYGETEANLYTGTLNLNIPIYTYKDADFEIPISLSYASNGNIVNEKAGILGPGWQLNAGGCITTEIRGIPDYGKNFKGIMGFMALHNNAIYVKNIGYYWRYINLLEGNNSSGISCPEIIYSTDNITNINALKFDGEPDIYHFNFLGHSGAFHLDHNNKLHVYNTKYNNKNYKIKIVTQDMSDYTCFNSFEITTDDGYIYTFKGESALNSTNLDVIPGNSQNLYPIITAWKLSEIEAPNGRRVTFNYKQYLSEVSRPLTSYYTGVLESNQIPSIRPEQDMYSYPGYSTTSKIDVPHAINKQTNKVALLTSIDIDNAATIYLDYQELKQGDKYQIVNSSQYYTLPYCYRLMRVYVNDKNTNTVANSAFKYKINTNGASTSYLASINKMGEGEYLMDYYRWNDTSYPYPANGTFSSDHWGYYNGNNNGNSMSQKYYVGISELDSDGLDETITSHERDANPEYAKCGLLEKIIYPTKGYSKFTYEPHTYSKKISRTKKSNFNTLLEDIPLDNVCGGLRIKSVNTYNTNNLVIDTKEYIYSQNSNSTGILLYFPRYKIGFSSYVGFERSLYEEATYYSANLLSFNYSHIEYSKVIEKRKDNSRIEYSFTNSSLSDKYMDEVAIIDRINERVVLNDNSIRYWELLSPGNAIHMAVAPNISKQADRGKLYKKEIYSASEITPLCKEETIFDTSKNLAYSLLPIYCLREFAFTKIYIDNFKPIENKTTQYFDNKHIINTKNITYNDREQIASISRVNSKGEREITRYEYASDYLGLDNIYTTMFVRNMLNYPVTIKTYTQSNIDETLIFGKKYTYALFNNIVKPSSVESYNTTTGTWQLEATFNSYDAKGNLTQSTDANGTPTSYIWGYNGLYLVAKGQNVTYSTLSAQVGASSAIKGGLTANHSTVSDNCPNALIDFYEYKPLIGISKRTDPSGMVLTYSYNSSGKLKAITDENGQLHNEYLYSPDNKQ